MTVRRYNFTGRLPIKHTDAAVTIHSSGSAFWFSADIALGDYGLPDDARVFVDAYRQTKRVRFEFGTVKHFRQPPEDERRLDGEFPSPDVVLFRVNAVDPASGRILAQADKINPNHGGGKESLLAVCPEDLEHACWKVNFATGGDGRPELQINKNIYFGGRAASSPAFRALVYPAVLREILNHILRAEKHFHTDEDDDWRPLWLRLAESKFGAGSPPLPDEYEEDILSGKIDGWIDAAVAGYSRSVNALRTYREMSDGS